MSAPGSSGRSSIVQSTLARALAWLLGALRGPTPKPAYAVQRRGRR